jgi:dienelactone hydrolase
MDVSTRGFAMSIQTAIAALLLMGTVIPAFSGDIVMFNGGDDEVVTGRLTKPEGYGPFPAVVLLYGFQGFDKHYDAWAERLGSWGYVTLQVGGGESNENSSLDSLPSKRAEDFCGARQYLANLPFVDSSRIGVVAWSQRGSSALVAFCARDFLKRENGFRAAVAFYPYCYKSLFRLDSPLLILIGEEDDWCPATFCLERRPSGNTPHEITLKVYPGAYHCFDAEGVDTNYRDHRLRYKAVAAADATTQVKKFLAKHLKRTNNDRETLH